MSLRAQAERDLAAIMESETGAFGVPLTLIDPDGNSVELNCSYNDISQTIDPTTGQMVSGRNASVTLRMSSILNAGFIIPKGVVDDQIRPWLVVVADVNGVSETFKIRRTTPDRTIGIVVCFLEPYDVT